MDQYFIDIDIDSAENMEEFINQFVADHGRIAMGVPGHLRYIFDDQCLADSFISLCELYNVLYQANCRVAGSSCLTGYPGAGIKSAIINEAS